MNVKDEITLFGRIDWTTYGLRTITVDDAVSIIRNGNYFIDDSRRSGMSGTLKEITEQMQCQPEGTDLQRVKAQFLPAVSFNGKYGDTGIMHYSSYTALDFDHIPSQEAYSDLYLRLMATPCVAHIYRTPSGRGLKAIVLHDNPNPEMHGNMYMQLMNRFQTPCIATDPKCRDLSRWNYLCHDSYAWSNPNPAPYHFVYDAALESPASSGHPDVLNDIQTTISNARTVSTDESLSDASVMNLLKSRCRRFHPEYLMEGARRDGAYWFGTQASKAGVGFMYGLDYVTRLYRGKEITLTRGGKFTDEEAKENYTNGYSSETYDENYRNNLIVRKQRKGAGS